MIMNLSSLEGLNVQIDETGNTPAIYFKNAIPPIDLKILEKLKAFVEDNDFLTTRICLHQSTDDSVHEMIIIHSKSGNHRVHKHFKTSESYQILEGELEVKIFDDDFHEISSVKLSNEDSNSSFLARISSGQWHVTLPVSDIVIFKETRPGPFDPMDTIFQS